MPDVDVQERLSAMDDAYEKASAEPGGQYELPEDGSYQAVIKRFDFPLLENESVLYLKTEYVIEHDAKYAGREVSTIHNLENPDRIEWVKKFLTTIGYEGTLSELPIKLGALVGTPVELAIKTSKKTDSEGRPYRNVYVNKSLGPPIGDVPAPEGFDVEQGSDDDDDIPF